MKKILILSIAILSIVSCQKEVKDYVTITGKITGLQPTDTVIKIRSIQYNKSIKIDSTGSFKDTLKIPKAATFNTFVNRNVRFTLFLRNGYDINIQADAKDINESLKFTGEGSLTNNYLANRIRKVLAFNKLRPELMKMDSATFYTKINAFESEVKSELAAATDLDTIVVGIEKNGLKGYVKGFKNSYQRQHLFEKTLGKGKISPKFNNLENFKGGKTSLDDFKGKYVYIDVWATWCRPCLAQIPDLKALEKEYHGKNIEFVSISTDKKDKHQAWINMIKSKGMSGTQLFLGEDKSFAQAYQITSIPRFIFIGKNGEILNANAPRPSQKEAVKAMFVENGLK